MIDRTQRNRSLGIRRLVIIALCLLIGGGVTGIVLSSADASRQVDARMDPVRLGDFSSFPLEKDVPGDRFAKLREGKFHGDRFGMYVSRLGKAKVNRRSPCITVARISAGGEYGNVSGCDGLAPIGSNKFPLYRLMGLSTGGKTPHEETLLAMTLAPSVVEAVLELESGPKSLARRCF